MAVTTVVSLIVLVVVSFNKTSSSKVLDMFVEVSEVGSLDVLTEFMVVISSEVVVSGVVAADDTSVVVVGGFGVVVMI